MITGIQYYQAMASGLTAARKTTIKAVLDTQEDITQFQAQFAGPFPFSTNGVIVALPSVGFAEEMQTKITFGNGATSTPSVGTFHHEVFHQWFGDHVSESRFNLTFWKEGWATISEYLNTARNAAVAAGGMGTPAGDAAFDASLVDRFNTNYGTTSTTFWTSAPSNPTVGNLFSTASTYTRPGTAYLALRQILGASASRPALGPLARRDEADPARLRRRLDHPAAAARTSSTQWLPNQSAGCHAQLDQFFTQWFDTAYPVGGGPANRPTLTGPGLSGPGFYDDAGACTRADADDRLRPAGRAAAGRAGLRRQRDRELGPAGVVRRRRRVHDHRHDGPRHRPRHVHDHGLAGGRRRLEACGIRGADVRDPPAGRDDRRAAGAVQRLLARHGLGDRRRVGGLGSDRGRDGAAGRPVARRSPRPRPRATLPGARTWAVLGIATVAPGSYPVSVTVTNDEGGVRDDGVRDRRRAGGRGGDLHRRHDRRLDRNARAAGDRPRQPRRRAGRHPQGDRDLHRGRRRHLRPGRRRAPARRRARDGYRDLHRLASAGRARDRRRRRRVLRRWRRRWSRRRHRRRPRLGGRLLRGLERGGHAQGGRRLEDESRR